MFVALNKDKKRVHISSILDNETYYCPICGEELRAVNVNIFCRFLVKKFVGFW